MNKLATENSAYLRHAAHQAIDWYPWSEEAFDRARTEDKPVFLSTGAVWCHWCHVMAKESFEDIETAGLMNALFINIKLDRDERPEIDRLYQQAVAAMGAGGGWPLSVFLTPDKHPFFGGTYFPPEDLQGRPGFKKVLSVVSNYYKTKRGEAWSYAASLMEALRQRVNAPETITQELLDEAEQHMLASFDGENGGFGTAPKFPASGALEFLLRRSVNNSKPAAGNAARITLEAMARGGFYDQLGGGFHRYSTDKAWLVPHFEKMADDNAGLLQNYIDGCMIFDDMRFREIAQGIITFTTEVLSDPRGGFYASQDADVTPDDEGGYFTWTHEEFRNALSKEELAVLSPHLLNNRAVMHHDREKNVLSLALRPEKIAEDLAKTVEEVRSIIKKGKTKLLGVRKKRQTPFVDQALYTSLNGMLIASYFHAFAVLGDEHLRIFGVRSLERVLQERFIQGKLFHTDGVDAVLEDYVYLIKALIAAYEATAVQRFLSLADGLMSTCLEKFYDAAAGGFFDTEGDVIGIRLKRIEDIPHPSANAVAIVLLLKLFLMMGKETYQRKAQQTLETFAGMAQQMSIHAGAYFCALDAWFRMIKLTVEAASDSDLARSARALTATMYVSIVYGDDNDRVIPCTRHTCLEPINDPVRLKDACLKL